MFEDLLECGEARPITLLYGNNRIDEIAYADVLKRALQELGIRTFYAVRDGAGATDDMTVGLVDADMIRARVPDYRERTFYISGPQAMVTTLRRTLREIGVRPWRIRTDFFPGLA
jgi:ferredoxin-NADP reductase